MMNYKKLLLISSLLIIISLQAQSQNPALQSQWQFYTKKEDMYNTKFFFKDGSLLTGQSTFIITSKLSDTAKHLLSLQSIKEGQNPRKIHSGETDSIQINFLTGYPFEEKWLFKITTDGELTFYGPEPLRKKKNIEYYTLDDNEIKKYSRKNLKKDKAIEKANTLKKSLVLKKVSKNLYIKIFLKNNSTIVSNLYRFRKNKAKGNVLEIENLEDNTVTSIPANETDSLIIDNVVYIVHNGDWLKKLVEGDITLFDATQ